MFAFCIFIIYADLHRIVTQRSGASRGFAGKTFPGGEFFFCITRHFRNSRFTLSRLLEGSFPTKEDRCVPGGRYSSCKKRTPLRSDASFRDILQSLKPTFRAPIKNIRCTSYLRELGELHISSV